MEIEVEQREKNFFWLWLKREGHERLAIMFAKTRPEAMRQKAIAETAYEYGVQAGKEQARGTTHDS